MVQERVRERGLVSAGVGVMKQMGGCSVVVFMWELTTQSTSRTNRLSATHNCSRTPKQPFSDSIIVLSVGVHARVCVCV